MTPSLRLGIDLDGVLADYMAGYRALLATIHETPLETDQYPKPVHDAAYRYIEASSTFWTSLDPYPGATGALMRLAQVDQVYFITRRYGTRVRAQSACWITAVGGEQAPAVIIVRKDRDKGPLADLLGLDAVIDDRPEVLAHVTGAAYLIDRPYNQTATLRRRQTRVQSLSEALDAIGVPQVPSETRKARTVH